MVAQGPFDGLMGFSEGGGVAAFLLIEDARRPFGNFKCAIFFSAAAPFDPDALREGQVRVADVATDGVLINVPTAHMWSAVDDENAEHARVVAGLSAEGLREEFVHRIGHDVPGSRSTEGLDEALRIIEHTIEKAKMGL